MAVLERKLKARTPPYWWVGLLFLSFNPTFIEQLHVYTVSATLEV